MINISNKAAIVCA